MAFYDIDMRAQVEGKHELWAIEEMIRFGSLVYWLKDLEKSVGRSGYGAEVGLRCLYLQFHYDLSDRELETRLRFDIAFRWFCGFTAYEATPDHSYFCRIRKSIGPKRIGKIFNTIVKRSKKAGIMRSVFQFVDATSIVTKNTTWAERDRAIQEGEDKLNNRNIKKYSADSTARFGCKGKDKYWFGYKGHASLDMGSGMIDKIAATPANISDQEGFKHICPREHQMIFGDKAYALKKAQNEMKRRGATSGAILKHNMKGKNKDLDRWRSGIRAPFEGVFSQFEKRARYRGLAKVQLQCFMDALVWNIKALIRINKGPLPVGT